MRHSNLGRGLASLIREVPSVPDEADIPEEELKGSDTPILSEPLSLPPRPIEHPSALTPDSQRLEARSRLEKLSVRPRTGLKAARLYLDKLRQMDGRTSLDLDVSRVDLTDRTMLSLRHGRISTQTRYQFFGVSIWK